MFIQVTFPPRVATTYRKEDPRDPAPLVRDVRIYEVEVTSGGRVLGEWPHSHQIAITGTLEQDKPVGVWQFFSYRGVLQQEVQNPDVKVLESKVEKATCTVLGEEVEGEGQLVQVSPDEWFKWGKWVSTNQSEEGLVFDGHYWMDTPIGPWFITYDDQNPMGQPVRRAYNPSINPEGGDSGIITRPLDHTARNSRYEGYRKDAARERAIDELTRQELAKGAVRR